MFLAKKLARTADVQRHRDVATHVDQRQGQGWRQGPNLLHTSRSESSRGLEMLALAGGFKMIYLW